MQNQDLIDYITHQRVHGATVANIKNALLHSGWEEVDIDKGLKATEGVVVSAPKTEEVIVKPDAPAGVPLEPAPKPKRSFPVGMVLALVGAIVVTLAAAVLLYIKFLMPKTPSAMPKAATSPTTAAPTRSDVPRAPGDSLVSTTSIPDAQPAAPATVAIPTN